MVVVAGAQLLAVAGLLLFRTTPLRRELAQSAGHPLRAALADLGDGFRYMVRTPWLLGTLLFATVLVLLIMGPIEVLLPFAVRDQTGGGAGELRPGHRRVRRGRSDRFPGGRLAAAAAALPEPDGDVLGRRLAPAGRGRVDRASCG